ncbi:MAG: hypothetical protein IJT94_11815 [Oscillibacter sp.]|nr:hypothetical protein [Oscillibacter sp.]
MTLPVFLSSPPLFYPGTVVATQGVTEKVSDAELSFALSRHLQGDWGDVCLADQKANDSALLLDTRILSAYHTEKDHVKFWIITEADRSATTVLLPDEY